MFIILLNYQMLLKKEFKVWIKIFNQYFAKRNKKSALNIVGKLLFFLNVVRDTNVAVQSLGISLPSSNWDAPSDAAILSSGYHLVHLVYHMVLQFHQVDYHLLQVVYHLVHLDYHVMRMDFHQREWVTCFMRQLD